MITAASNTTDRTTLRQLRIKTGVVSRISKDISSYQVEADIQQQRLDRMKMEGQDEYDILKMGQVVQESLMMVPHCVKKLVTARADLESLLESLSDVTVRDLEAGEETEVARMIRKAKTICDDSTQKIKEYEDSHQQEN